MTPDAALWPGPWAKYKYASRFIASDLAAARAAWIKAGATDEERGDRQKSDVLKYRTDEGQADFHALRQHVPVPSGTIGRVTKGHATARPAFRSADHAWALHARRVIRSGIGRQRTSAIADGSCGRGDANRLRCERPGQKDDPPSR